MHGMCVMPPIKLSAVLECKKCDDDFSDDEKWLLCKFSVVWKMSKKSVFFCVFLCCKKIVDKPL